MQWFNPKLFAINQIFPELCVELTDQLSIKVSSPSSTTRKADLCCHGDKSSRGLESKKVWRDKNRKVCDRRDLRVCVFTCVYVCLCECYHGENGSRGHVFAESSIERHVLQVQVVLLHVVLRGLNRKWWTSTRQISWFIINQNNVSVSFTKISINSFKRHNAHLTRWVSYQVS